MDNVFVGSGVKIMPGVRIGPNVIVAAGAIVTKDIPSGEVWGGVPAKKIGMFDDLMKKREAESSLITQTDRFKRVESEWAAFYKIRK